MASGTGYTTAVATMPAVPATGAAAAPPPPRLDPSNPSSDWLAMQGDWTMIQDIRDGVRVVQSRCAVYLPRYPAEDDESYKLRVRSTPWIPEFVDALRNLCSKPFTKEVSVQGDDVSPDVKDFADDVDGEGNNLHSFARELFVQAVADGVVGLYVTYPTVEVSRTLADEKRIGARPYWVKIRGPDILALYTKKVAGREVVQHIRIRECTTERDGFSEVHYERVRVVDAGNDEEPPTWTLYEKHVDQLTNKITWVVKGTGTFSMKEIPIVLFFTGERSGIWCVKPPLLDLANMQMDIYRATSRYDEILTYAGSPMLKAVGLSPPKASRPPDAAARNPRADRSVAPAQPTVLTGPKRVLFAPPGADGPTDWDFVQPNAANITAVGQDVKDKIEEFRALSMQPLSPASGRLTATSSAIDAASAHSAVEAWANGLKDVLEQAFVFTREWQNHPNDDVQVSVHTDYGVGIDGTDDTPNLLKLREDGDISQLTLWDELQRRGKLGPQFDPDVETKRLADEAPPEGDFGDDAAAAGDATAGLDQTSDDDVNSLFHPSVTGAKTGPASAAGV